MRHGGALICFIGIDGSGKTTQAKMLVNWLSSQGYRPLYVWSRGEVLQIRQVFLRLGRRALGTSEREIANNKNSYREYQSKKSRLLHNPVVRALWSTTTQFEHIAQINRDIRGKIKDGNVVVCDRYFWDSAIDMAILNNKKSEWLPNRMNRMLWNLVPKPMATFFIDIPPEEALKRKDDIPSLEYVKRRVDMYRYLSTCLPVTVIDGVDDPASISALVANLVKKHVELR